MEGVSGAEVLIKALRAEGVTKVFGISGHGLVTFLEGLRNEPGIEFVSSRHEESAAHMADAWARVTGEVGVCASTVGPGAVNLAAGLAEAYADNIPVLAVTANIQSFISYPGIGALEDMDSFAFFKPITKWNAVVHDRGRVAELVQRAFREATTGRPGPVHLDVPMDILCQRGPAPTLPEPRTYRAMGRVRGDDADIARAVELLGAAERPLLVAGGGVVASNACEEIRQLASALGAPLTTTVMGSGCAPSDERYFGDSGWLGGNAVLMALNAADVILAVGCRFSSWLGIGRPPIMAGPPQQKIIQVDVDGGQIGKSVGVAAGIVGDAKAVLSAMLAGLPARGGSPAVLGWGAQLRGVYQEYLASLEPLLGGSEGPITQGRLAKEVGEFIDDKRALVTIDGGSTLLWGFTYLGSKEPRTRFCWAGGGHLGVGQPFANAVQMANPGRLVVNFCGDGGFGMTLQELDTAARHRLPVINVINNDGGWGMCKSGQFLLYGPQACDGIDQDFGGVDYAAVARDFSCFGETVERVEDIRPALQRAIASGLPAVLDVKVSPVFHPMFGVMAAVVLQGCELPAPSGPPPAPAA
jgi:thiamine pyrophosphate-dependent acetolactate synthase large subunit-like protein